MRVDLKVTQTPDLKSKQPWPLLAWQGNQVNNVLLVDAATQRLKVLCLTESGKGDSKKKVARLQSRLQHICVTSFSACGNYLVCLLHSGDLLVWHKDTDKLQTIHGIPELVTHNKQADVNATRSPKPQLFISQDAHKLLVVIGCSQLFLWEIDQSVGTSFGKQAYEIKGSWSHVGVSNSHTMPSADCRETAVHAQFFTDVVLGDCCICSFVFNHRDSVHITSVILRWTEPQFIYSISQPKFTAQWDSLQYPLSGLAPGCRPIRHRGAYVIQHSHQGHTLAVAANQRSPYTNRVMFLSVMASGAVVVDLKGCGCTVKKPNPLYARSYWIADLSWTSDDLFVVCITKRGALAILSRLGEPLVLQSEGCSVEHGPQYFLPFHPLITIVPNKPSKSSSSTPQDNQPSPTSSIKSEADEKRQRFSVATHPTKPIILCSDGYLATIMELPENLTCTSLMTDFLSEGRTALNLLSEKQHLGLSRLATLKFQKTLRPSQQQQQQRPEISQLQGSDTSSREGLLSTVGSDADFAGPFSNLDEGKIVFGFPMELEATQRGTLKTAGDGSLLSITSRTQRALFSTLGLGLSHTGTWSPKLDHLLVLTTSSIIRLCEVILLHSSSSLGSLRQQDKEQSLQRVCTLFQDALTTFLWDTNYRNSQVTALKMSHCMVRALLRHSKILPSCLAPKCSVAILQFSERLLTNVYTIVPVQQPSFPFEKLYFHRGDVVEGALFSSIRRKMAPQPQEPIYISIDGSVKSEYTLEPAPAGVSIGCLLGKRLIQSWKLLHDHLIKQYTKLLQRQDSTTSHRTRRSRDTLRKQKKLLLLLCGVQRKLHHLGWNVPLSFSQLWIEEIHKGFLKGCEWYINGYVREAIHCWQLTTHQAQAYHANNTPPSTLSSSDNALRINQEQRHQLLGTPLVTASLVAILYTHLEHYDLMSALKLVDRLVHCYQGDGGKVKGHRTKKGSPTRLVRTSLSFLETIRKSGKVHFTAVLPCVPSSEHRSVVACLARWMALYFTNQPLYIYPACSAILMPSLLQGELAQNDATHQPRTLPLYHDHISSAIRQQELSEVWTADTALALLLVCGLVPEAVWLARELGDWKSAFTLAVLYSEQNSWVMQLPNSFAAADIVLPGHLTPDAIIKEGLGSLLQTSPDTPTRSKHERRASMDGMDSSGNSSILQVPKGAGMKKSSSMCSIHDEDKASQEQLSRSLTDMLTAATLIGLDPTLWLLGNLTDSCISLVGEFNTLVPEDFYLPAPPYYCPQPEYIPKEDESDQVLLEVRIRRKVNDLIQLILLVLNCSKCSLPCAKWYVQQLGGLLQNEGRRKKTAPCQLPKALAAHTKYQLDLLEGISRGDHLPPSLSKLLHCFRNLCSMVWLLHARDRLSMAIRKYQARREKSLRVKPEDLAEASQHKTLLMSIIEWAGCLHPFINFLRMEDEIQDVLLTAISELPANKHTVALLAKYFHSGQDALYPAVEEKFLRLMEKLKRKREVVDKSQRKRGGGEEGKSKTTVKYETLHRYYKRQCKRRKVELSNRQEDYGSLEEQIFDTEEPHLVASMNSKPSTSKGSSKDTERSAAKGASSQSFAATAAAAGGAKTVQIADDQLEEQPSPRQAAHSHPKQKKILRQQSFSMEDDLHPCVGSREFESSGSFLDFLETFFLVAFGKIAQNLSPSSKPDVPLLGALSERVKKEELNSLVLKILGRQKSKIELDISDTLHLPPQLYSKSIAAEDSDMEDERTRGADDDIIGKVVHDKGLFYVLGKKPDTSDSLLNETIHGKLFSRYGYCVPPTPTPRSKKSEDWQFTGSFLHNEPAKPYANVRLNLGKKYQKHVDLLQWLARWTERQQRLHHGAAEGKAILRVKLPQQLILNSLWLLENCYYPDLFQSDALLGDDAIAMTVTEDTTSLSTSQRVHFDDAERLKSTPEVGRRQDGGKKTGGGKKKEKKEKQVVIQAMLKPSSSSEDLIEEITSEQDSSQDMVAKMRKLLSKKKSKRSKKHKDGKTQDNAASGGAIEHSEPTQQESQGDAREKEKQRRKKRQLPTVTSDHLSTAVDYKTEAERARLRLQRPGSSSLRTSPIDTSQRSTPATAERENMSTSSVTGEDVPDGRSRGQVSNQKSVKVQEQTGEGVEPVAKVHLGNVAVLHSDSDSSSLNVSSLDEDEIAGLQREMAGSNVDMPHQDQLSLKSSPGDVRKMVREEFRKMMEKSIMSVLNSNTTPPSTQKPQPNNAGSSNAAATDSQQHPNVDPSSLLHPQAQLQGSAQGVHTGTQAPQPLLQTWHGEGSMLHQQSLRGASNPAYNNQGGRHAAETKHSSVPAQGVGDTDRGSPRTQSVSKGTKSSSVLRNQQGPQGNQSAFLPSDSSGINIPMLTLQDLDSVPVADSGDAEGVKRLSRQAAVVRPDVHLPINERNYPEGNRNNNRNQNHVTLQSAPAANSAHQNGWDEEEYDTIPTRDSDEFVPSNSTSSHQDNAAVGNGHQVGREQPERVPPPGYPSTFAFAQPQIPPLLKLNNDEGGHRPQSYGPPPPPPVFETQGGGGYPPFVPRQGWGVEDGQTQVNTANVQPYMNGGHPYATHHTDYRDRPQRQAESNYQRQDEQNYDHNSNSFLPPIPLLTLDPRRPTYQPPVHNQVPTPRDNLPHMRLLTLDPRPSYHHPAPHQQGGFPSNLPHGDSQVDPSFTGGPVMPHPMPLLHLDEPAQPYILKSSRGGIGTVQLIPPEDIIAFEQRKYREKVERLRQQGEMEVGEERQEDGQVNVPLLHLDTEEDNLDNKTRQRRRKKTKDASKTVIKPKEQPSSRKTSSARAKKERRQRVISPTTTTTTSDEERRDVMREDDVGRKRHVRSKPIITLVDKPEEEVGEEHIEHRFDEDGNEDENEDDIQEVGLPGTSVQDNTADQSLGKGYAIRPGSYDAILDDRDARPALPTSAEVHLNVVRKLQEHPKTTRQDASSMTTHHRDVATSMETNGLPIDRASRFGPVQDPISQYTTAATGVSNDGHIVAPDIFFGLRFANKPDNQAVMSDQSEPTKDTTTSSKPSDKGRDFISVVDIDSDAIGEILQQPDQSIKHVVSTPRLDQTGADLAQSGVDAQVVDSNTGPEPSVAELHYNAMFHRDAHPEGLSPLSTQQISEDQAGPDPVTEQVLKSRAKSHSVKAVRNRSQTAREQSKQRVYQRLAEMADQLDAIDEVSKHMEDDFKNTKIMLNTVEHLSDTMTSSVSRPRLDYLSSEPMSQDPRITRPSAVPTAEQPGHEEEKETEERPERDEGDVEDGEGNKKKMHVTIKEEEQEEEEEDEPERGPMDDTGGEDALGITGLSGVSDIIAEALADDDTKDLGISEETRDKLRAKRAKKFKEPDLDALDYTNLSSDQLRDIFTPRSQHTPDDDEDEDLMPSYAKKPSQRSETQRKELKEWTAKKQAKNIADYKKRREELAEKEPRPYQPPKDAPTQLGSTQKEIQQAKHVRDGKRRTTDEEHYKERAKAAKQLMAEIFAETLVLPPDPEPHPRPSQRTSKPNQAVTKAPSTGKRKPIPHTTGTDKGVHPQRGVPKGTYLFIDSEVYPPRGRSVGNRTPGLGNTDRTRQDRVKGDSIIHRGGQDGVDRRVPPIQLDYSSDEDYDRLIEDYNRLDAISEGTDNQENEPVRDYKPKPYTQIVKVQRPEVTRKKRASPRKQKTYGEMLKALKQETSKPGSAGSVKAKQRLYGSKRVPGAYKGSKRESPRVAKPYTQRLAEMKASTQSQSRLRVRPRHSASLGTATMTLDVPNRRQQVEGRGIRAEATPRTSTPYTERLAMLSNSGTYRGREGVVSPAPKVGLKYQPKNKLGSTYVERLQESSAGAPKPRHKVAYARAMGTTYKAPQLHTPSPRRHPYRVPSQEEADPWEEQEEELSGMSDLSPWSLSDDVKRILQGDNSRESLARGYTTDEDFAGLDSLGDQDDYLASVDVRELEELASIGSESIGNIDWSAVDKMIADVE